MQNRELKRDKYNTKESWEMIFISLSLPVIFPYSKVGIIFYLPKNLTTFTQFFCLIVPKS